MVAAIDTTNGVSLFASLREPAWHGLGTVIDKEITDYLEFMEYAHLRDWDIRLIPIVGAGRSETEAFEVVRTNPIDGGIDRLGIVGERYGIAQNEDTFKLLQSLHDGARWETGGSLKGGKVVFGSIAYDREIILDPSGVADKTTSYLLIHTSHDGSTAVGGGVTPIRVVCANTLNIAVGNIKNTFKIRHTKSVEERMKVEAELWRDTNKYLDVFEADAKALFEQNVTDEQYFGIVTDMFPKPEKDVKGAFTKWEKRQEIYSQAWKGGPNAGIRNTGWGAFNALTEANQWGRKIQDTDNGTENFFAAGAGFDIPTNNFRQEAHARVKALA